MNKKLWLICLKWGGVLGGFLAALELVKMVARNVEYGNAQVLDIAMIIVYILILYAAVKEFKASFPARLSFPKAYMASLFVSIIGAVLLLGYDMVHYAVIEKDGLSKKYEIALQNFHKAIEKDTLTADELRFYTDTVGGIIDAVSENVAAENALQDSILQNYAKGVAMIRDFYMEKLTLQQQRDTAENYRLGKFSPFSRRLLVETLAIYVEQNAADSSTRYVTSAYQAVNAQLELLDMADRRYEQNKSHVPHYDKPGRYACISAVMYLIYGMFFALFIAMYHYRSKETIEDMQPAYKSRSESLEEEPENEQPKE